MSFSQDEEHKNEELWNWLVISQITAILPWLIFFFYALFATLLFFDTSSDFYNEKQSPFALVLLWNGVILPIFSVIGAWKAYRQGKNKKAAIWSALTLLPILFLIVPVVISII